MTKAEKIEQTALRIVGAGIAAWFILAARNYARRKGTEDYFAEKHENDGTDGVGSNTPDYTISLLNRYLSCHRVFDVQVALNETNSKGHVYVLCGDDQYGNDFYISKSNLPYFKKYCKENGIEYEEFYLPNDSI